VKRRHTGRAITTVKVVVGQFESGGMLPRQNAIEAGWSTSLRPSETDQVGAEDERADARDYLQESALSRAHWSVETPSTDGDRGQKTSQSRDRKEHAEISDRDPHRSSKRTAVASAASRHPVTSPLGCGSSCGTSRRASVVACSSRRMATRRTLKASTLASDKTSTTQCS